MERKYEIRFCSCGTIHFIPTEKIDNALKNDKDLLWICGRCGAAVRIGADREPNWIDDSPDAPEEIFNMYSYDLNPNMHKQSISITPESFKNTKENKGLSEIFYSAGIQVPMMSGNAARMHNRHGEYFLDIWWPDWYKIERSDITKEEIMEFISKYKEDCKTVNMTRFIRETPKEYIELLAQSWCKEFNWDGTEYEKMHKQWLNKIHGK